MHNPFARLIAALRDRYETWRYGPLTTTAPPKDAYTLTYAEYLERYPADRHNHGVQFVRTSPRPVVPDGWPADMTWDYPPRLIFGRIGSDFQPPNAFDTPLTVTIPSISAALAMPSEPDLDTVIPVRAMALPPYVPPPRIGPPSLYPRPDLTPGVTFPQITEADVRVPGYAKRVRAVSDATKRAVYERYGLDPAQHPEAEVDHYISLCLAGTNDIENLWPEPAFTPDAPGNIGFRQKDAVEMYLYQQVCSGALTLKQAQDKIRGDWYAVWRDEMPHAMKAMALSPDAPEQP